MGTLSWLLGVLALILLSGFALFDARRSRKKDGYTIVAVERPKEYST